MSKQPNLTEALHLRSDEKCELCGATDELTKYLVPESASSTVDEHVLCCDTCTKEINSTKPNADHWTCLTDSMWSVVPAVQVMAWRLLNRHGSESWATDALDMLYLEDDVQNWANKGLSSGSDDQDSLDLKHVDSNGTQLEAGDTVVLIKDLNVKGAGFTAKRGTAVRNISVSPTNASHIEGRVNGQQIVILTEFVKKS
ncbi:MAG: PhnA domain-containing protein [Alphaproteobacteria bacterium]